MSLNFKYYRRMVKSILVIKAGCIDIGGRRNPGFTIGVMNMAKDMQGKLQLFDSFKKLFTTYMTFVAEPVFYTVGWGMSN